MITIYTSKKNGKSFTMITLDNGKFQLTSTTDSNDIVITTESVLKRWYKKSVEVDFTTAAPAPEKSKKAVKVVSKKSTTHKRSKKGLNTVKSAGEIGLGCFIAFYPRPTMSIQVVGLEAAQEIFPGMELDHNTALLSCEEFNRPRRAYVNAETGNVGIRFHNQLIEISGLKAYV